MINVLITSITSVVAIFISHYLGRKAAEEKQNLEIQHNIYMSLYIPLIKEINQRELEFLNYHWMVAFPRYSINENDFLQQLLFNNFEKLPPEVIKLYSQYNNSTINSIPFFLDADYDFYYEPYLKESSRLFDEIIILLLTEGSKKSEILKLPDIAKPTLDFFLKGISYQKNNCRYLPLSVRRHKIKSEPPFQ